VDKNGRTYIHYCVAPLEIASYENLQFLSYLLEKEIDVDR